MTELESFWFEVEDIIEMSLIEINEHGSYAKFKDNFNGIHTISYYIALRFLQACTKNREIPASSLFIY